MVICSKCDVTQSTEEPCYTIATAEQSLQVSSGCAHLCNRHKGCMRIVSVVDVHNLCTHDVIGWALLLP